MKKKTIIRFCAPKGDGSVESQVKEALPVIAQSYSPEASVDLHDPNYRVDSSLMRRYLEYEIAADHELAEAGVQAAMERCVENSDGAPVPPKSIVYQAWGS